MARTSSNGEDEGTGVLLSGSSARTTSGALSVTGSAVGDFGTGVFLTGSATVGAGPAFAARSSQQFPGGAIAIKRHPYRETGGEGVGVNSTTISNTTGVIGISGTVTGAAGSFADGVYFYGVTLNTGSGDITVAGTVPSVMNGSIGFDMHGSSVQSASGNIALSGQSIGAAFPGASVFGPAVPKTVYATVYRPAPVCR